ncbi:hypothetical protein EXIGLDRAFT_828052 [Exidia glandulosa HHB12029]|uniref:Phospholipid/glycerol acyltransferase domain-containing protein n=1 Tax=Exidia glandulosa HHB12029 TaxID=1314781 RepID=A0A165QVG8_EXIGL|nr:hypothetical protein EXIGLDRAFT_828052 [Exidia glandulosa HHB12029]
MEKYSAFRDPGTGIQPFLTPVAPHSPSANVLLALSPLLYLLGAIRTLLLLVLALLHALLVVPLRSIPGPATGWLGWVLNAVICRTALFVLGFLWIPVEVVSRRRVRGAAQESWSPRAGDIIVSNWASFIELLWLAFRFDPIFLIPVSTPVETAPASAGPNTPGRSTGTGSAALANSPSRYPQRYGKIIGFRTASLWQIIRHTGLPPVLDKDNDGRVVESVERIRSKATRPVVVFPECTTSNGRGLLKFADVFGRKTTLPVQGYRVFVMAVRYEAPTDLQPTLTHTIPTTANPIGSIFPIARSFMPSSVSIRLLAPSDSPSSGSFVVSDVVSATASDHLSDACAALISTTGKLKRTGQGWEDKVAFLDFYHRKVPAAGK